MSRLKNIFLMSGVLVGIFVVGGGYWLIFQKSQIEPFAKQIDSIKVNQNSPVGMKDYVLMKRDLITSQNTLNNSVFQIASSLLLLSTAYIAWRNLVVSEKKQIVESFAKAVEQLGNEELQSRVGGIFVLEEIAQSSPEYHWTVIEVLTSYIRDKSLKGESIFKREYKVKAPYSRRKETEEILSDYIVVETKIFVTIDIQAALTVIFRRNSKQDPQDRVIDLSCCDIRGANMKNANLAHANLRESRISEVKLQNANLSSANLQETDLSQAVLDGANLSKSSLNNASLKNASLKKANLQDSDLTYANFQEACLKDAKLNRAILYYSDFKSAKLQGANLREAKLKHIFLETAEIDHTTELDKKWSKVYEINISGAKKESFTDGFDFRDAILINADFESCTFKRANFSKSQLEGANFKNANLEGVIFGNQDLGFNLKYTNFCGAYLKGVVFHFVNLENANFENACLEDAKFIHSRLPNTSFCKANLKKAVFDLCSYEEPNFQEADIDNATFRGNTQGVDFTNSKNHENAKFVLTVD
jgi:uncharacterized protein YjbI with pentapeptide repeats